jgi:hypothetical protein
LFLLSLFLCSCTLSSEKADNSNSHIKPWEDNPAYWQYKGKPVLLLGGTDNDNLFQNINLETHLDSLQAIGGNCIRNTMSDRDSGNQRTFAMTSDGKYDLNTWNEKYWQRFEDMLRLTSERDIIVQIEVWDRFDHYGRHWMLDPYNPKNNINYSYEEAGLDSLYPAHPNLNQQPFFFTVPELNNNEILLTYQNAFVKKLLTYSLKYNNVLYCIDNETSGAEEWAVYWRNFIIENSNGKDIYVTQMWDKWDVKDAIHLRTLDHPERYGYIDISQNSQIAGRANWDNAQYVFDHIKDNPRPVNSTKIYGSDQNEDIKWTRRGMNTEHGVQTFFRNVVGGFASSRFHRPEAGLGLSELSMNCIRTVRNIEEYVKMWDINPRMDLLVSNEKNLAYIAASEGESYVIYFTKPGTVQLDLQGYDKKFKLRWINIENAEWDEPEVLKGGSFVELTADKAEGSFAVITRR